MFSLTMSYRVLGSNKQRECTLCAGITKIRGRLTPSWPTSLGSELMTHMLQWVPNRSSMMCNGRPLASRSHNHNKCKFSYSNLTRTLNLTRPLARLILIDHLPVKLKRNHTDFSRNLQNGHIRTSEMNMSMQESITFSSKTRGVPIMMWNSAKTMQQMNLGSCSAKPYPDLEFDWQGNPAETKEVRA